MSKQKLSVGYITICNDINWLLLSLESVEPIADEIIIIVGDIGPELETLMTYTRRKSKYKVILSKYPGNNGSQYNKILQQATGDWILILDSDEVLGDNSHLLLEYIKKDYNIFNIRMNHCISDLAHVDATLAGNIEITKKDYEHYVSRRLFKNEPGIKYDESEHGLVYGFNEEKPGLINDVIIWHYGKCKQMMELKNKYLMNVKRSKIHTKEFLKEWYNKHLLGEYPKKIIDTKNHPSVVRREFMIEK